MFLKYIMIGEKEIPIKKDKSMNKMNIVFLSNYSGMLDEGMANVSYNVFKNLQSKFSNLLLINISNVGINFWKKILSSKIDVLHYFPGPTLKGLILIKIIQLLTNCKTVVSATQPRLPTIKYFKLVSMFLKPDIILVQSQKSESFFKQLNYTTKFIPNGVDLERFVPADAELKSRLRQKYGFDESDFIILHVGPIKRGRNQYSLIKIPNVKVLLIVSVTNPSEDDILQELKNKNVVIWKKYVKDIQEIYELSDVYVWPSIQEFHGIEIPLSVLEAMSCNLPVISTRYGALERIFQEGNGLFFIDNQENISDIISKIKNTNIKIETRKKTESLSWKNIAEKISNVYDDLYKSSEN